MRILVAAIFLLFAFTAQSQGCSDAGFCTMGAMRPDQNYSKRIAIKLRSLELNFYRGTTTLTPIIYVGTIDFNIALNNDVSLQVKLPYQAVSGNLGENQGLGDISLSLTKSTDLLNDWGVNWTLGAKIPSNKSDDEVNNEFTHFQSVDFPMYYQVSLGSYDAVGGISMINEKWLFATGVQIALTENENHFQWSDWPGYPDQEYLQSHDVGRDLKRGIDVMARVERNWRFTNFNFSLGLLPIWRITKDEVADLNGNRVKLDKTTGMALSALASFGYQFDVNNSIKIIRGYKLTDRKNNPDGLTRDDVWSVSYIYKF